MAFHSYVSFKGQKQGQLKAESQKAGRSDKWTEVVSIDLGSEVPVDPKSGRPKGARTHFPLTITKEIGVASPQLLNAHWANELFDEIVIEIVGRPDTGKGETVAERITLTNGQIVHYRVYVGKGTTGANKSLEEYSFTFANMRRVGSR
jgi:type VI secretion system Hcp family effector